MKELENLIISGKLDEAEEMAKRTAMPDTTRVSVLATIEMRRGNLQKAEVLFERVLSADPNHILAKGNLGQLLCGQGKYKRAMPMCESAFKQLPKNEIYALNYASCLADVDKVPEAIAVLKPFLDSDKPSVRIMVALSSLHRANLDAARSLEILGRARELYPDSAECDRAMADALAELDPLQARSAFKKSAKTATSPITIGWNWSFVELRLQNFKKGWELYENGLTDKIGKVGRPLPGVVRMFPMVTDLDTLDPDKYTLFACEQGIGDQVLFLGCFGKVLERYPKAILIAEDRMLPVLTRAFPEALVATYGFAYSLSRQLHRLNGVFPIGSFQKNFRNTTAAFRKTRSVYLQPDAALVDKYRSILVKKRGERTFIGISWTGGHWDRQKKTKSFPFELFGRLMKDPRYSFVCLQYGDVTEDKALATREGWPVTFINGLDFKKNLDAWTALACACDRIVSVSTALVHFAGACGKRVDVLLSDRQGPFIWGLEDGPSIAYTDVHTWRRKGDESPEAFFDRMREQLL